MPNWCSTDIRICHKDKLKTKELYKNLLKWTSSNFHENGFGLNWLGNIVGNSGIAEWKDFGSINCKGYISKIEYAPCCIGITTQTAWTPMIKMWQMVCNKYLPDAKILYIADELGSCLHLTNDLDVAGTYYIDVYGFTNSSDFEDIDTEFEVEEDEVIKLCQRILNTNESNIKLLLEDINKTDWINVSQYENCPISECK